jgi:hypothetical protein
MSTVLQLVGLGAVVAGAALIAPAAGLIVGGVLLVLVGVALEPRGK